MSSSVSVKPPARRLWRWQTPELSACLTLNKGDFIRTGGRGGTYPVTEDDLPPVAREKAVQAKPGSGVATDEGPRFQEDGFRSRPTCGQRCDHSGHSASDNDDIRLYCIHVLRSL